MINSIMPKPIIIFILLFFCLISGCSTVSSPPKETLVFPILPVVFGYNGMQFGEEFEVLGAAKFMFFKEFNVLLDYETVYYTPEYIPVLNCDIFEIFLINNYNINDLIGNQCRYAFIIFFEYNQIPELSLLGCSPLKGVEDPNPPSRMWIYLNGVAITDQFVILHELAHMFGAEHTEDHSLMNPYLSETEVWDFNQETKDVILEFLESYRRN